MIRCNLILEEGSSICKYMSNPVVRVVVVAD